MKCYIVKDLLSNYIDDLCSEETNADIKKHLESCDDCRSIYEKMSAVIPQEILPEDKNIDFLRKLKAKMLRKNMLTAIVTYIAVLISFLILARV